MTKSFGIQESPGEEYRNFIHIMARNFPCFTRLNDFFQQPVVYNATASITMVEFFEQANPSVHIEVKETDLERYLASGSSYQLCIIENVTPGVLALLGGYWKVDPQFFLDHLDSSEWYRLREIEDHLPALISVQEQSHHVHFRFIGPREVHPYDLSDAYPHIPDPIEQDSSNTVVARIAGALNPLGRDGKSFAPVVMTRQTATAWFDSSDQKRSWQKGIILLDSPFQLKGYGQRQNSKYRYFGLFSIPEVIENPDSRHSYRTSLIHCLLRNPNVQKMGVPQPFILLQDLYRLICSEWVVMNTYIERELGTIDYRLEKEQHPKSDLLEQFLNILFILRRRGELYEKLINEQRRSCRVHGRKRWQAVSTVSTDQEENRKLVQDIAADLEMDFDHVYTVLHRNNERITQVIKVLMALMSIHESKATIAQNQNLGLLTIVATLFLPFNTVATIMNLQGNFSPAGLDFWVFWVSSSAVGVALLLLYLVYRTFGALRRRSQLKST